jgi:hypothetical protein
VSVELRSGSRGAFPRRMRAAAGGRWLFVTRALPAERSSRLHDYFFFGKVMRSASEFFVGSLGLLVILSARVRAGLTVVIDCFGTSPDSSAFVVATVVVTAAVTAACTIASTSVEVYVRLLCPDFSTRSSPVVLLRICCLPETRSVCWLLEARSAWIQSLNSSSARWSWIRLTALSFFPGRFRGIRYVWRGIVSVVNARLYRGC